MTTRWGDIFIIIDQIRSNMVAFLNFKMTTVKQFINRPFVDPTNVGAAAKIYIYLAPLKSYRAKYILHGCHIGFQDGRHEIIFSQSIFYRTDTIVVFRQLSQFIVHVLATRDLISLLTTSHCSPVAATPARRWHVF